MTTLVDKLQKYREGIGGNVAVWLHVLDSLKRVVLWNNAAEIISGYTESEVLDLEQKNPGKIWSLLFKNEKHVKQINDFSNEVMADNILVSGINVPILCKDNKERIISWHSNNIKDPEGRVLGVLTIGLDVTQQNEAIKEAEESKNLLRALTSQLSLTEEMERKKLAQNLHDQVSQRLAVSKMKLGMLKLKTTMNDEDKRVIEETYMNIEQVMEDIRNMTFEISSPLLFTEGLSAAMYDLAEQTVGKHGITFTLNETGEKLAVNENIKVVLYQVIRELFYNIIKHSGADKVEAMIFTGDNTVSVMVNDNGKGFNFDEEKKLYSDMKHFGLFSIMERIEYLGGSVDIQSAHKNGTSITVHVPLGNNK